MFLCELLVTLCDLWDYNNYLQQTMGRVHTRRILTHNKRKEDGRNWRSIFHDSKKIPQAMRNMKNSILKETLIHVEHLDNKWYGYEWRIWLSWKKESTHETNKDKYSIVISWYFFVMYLFASCLERNLFVDILD